MELPDRNARESSFAATLARSFSDYRHQIEPYLSRGEPVPDALYAEIEQDAKEKITAILLLLFTSSAMAHGAEASAVEAAGLAFAEQRAAEVSSQLVANTRARLSAPLGGSGGAGQLSAADIAAARSRQVVTALGPERASTIAVTETTVATSAGGERGVEGTIGLREFDLWYTAADDRVCPRCGPLHATKRSQWSTQFPGGPPAHPRCRCRIEYEYERN